MFVQQVACLPGAEAARLSLSHQTKTFSYPAEIKLDASSALRQPLSNSFLDAYLPGNQFQTVPSVLRQKQGKENDRSKSPQLPDGVLGMRAFHQPDQAAPHLPPLNDHLNISRETGVQPSFTFTGDRSPLLQPAKQTDCQTVGLSHNTAGAGGKVLEGSVTVRPPKA